MDAIAVIDFGSQYAHLIASRIRRLGVYAEIFTPETPVAFLATYKGIVLSGGPNSVYEKGAPTIDPKIFSLGVPILGLCYGHQLMAHLLGGKVEPGRTKEYGLARLSVLKKTGIFKGLKHSVQVWMSHGDSVTALPERFIHLGKTDDCFYAAMAHPQKKIFSVQFHVEVAHTTEGLAMLTNFLDMCGVKREWDMRRFMEEKMAAMSRTLKDRKVFLLVSGGVDSTVAYVLLAKTLGDRRVYGLFVDTGFLRKDEAKKTAVLLKKIGVKNFHVVAAGRQFFKKLKGVTDPEEKRRIIGDMFLKVQAGAIQRLKLSPDEWVLGQGTIYPDTIESAGTRHADRIKTHHNRVPEILELIKKGRVVEPLAQLYKDEVRRLGRELGLPREAVRKHPFPGPGLAVRILCHAEPGGRRKGDQVFGLPANLAPAEEAIEKFLLPHGLSGKILPIRSVGVQGDARTYRHPLVLWGKHMPFDRLENLSTALTNRFAAINRVCLLLAPDKIHSVSAIPATLTPRRIQLLSELDDTVMGFIKKRRMEEAIWQFPTILLPLSVNGAGREAVVLRPVCSDEAMTANFYKMAAGPLKDLTRRLAPKVSAVLYDITNKPPGTIEWE